MASIHPDAWVSEDARIFGDVSLGEGASLWPFSVIRAECHHVHIGRFSNIQDFAMVHIGYSNATEIGDYCSIAHNVTVHGATIEDNCLIGIGAVLMDGAVIQIGSIVATGAVVTEGTNFPPRSVIAGTPAKVIASRNSTAANRLNALKYAQNATAYRQGNHRAWHGQEYEDWLRAAEEDSRKAT